MTQETKFPTTKPRRSSLKRQRLAVLICVGVVAVLAVAFGLVWRFTNRILVEYPDGTNVVDTDGIKYYAVKKDGVWIMQNEHGDICELTSEGLYKTKDGTLVMVSEEDGTPTVVATVLLSGTEQAWFSSSDASYDILLYPMLQREEIQSIEIKNEKDHFTFERQKDDTFAIKGHESTPYDSTMFSTLIVVAGYTNTIARLDLSPENPDAEGFRQNGYAEYGLPENPEDAENYFIITALDGTTHKVIIGDIILDDTGYYARYADRPDVYVLQQMEESAYNSTLSGTLLCAVEDYVTPTVTTTMSTTNYFDVTDFTIWGTDGSGDLADLKNFEKIVQFSYEPIELRRDTYYAHTPYVGEGKLSGYSINENKADACLQSIADLAPSRTVKLYDDDGDTEDNLTDFVKTYGVAFAIEFTFNASRAGEDGDYEPTEKIPHQIWISPLTKNADGEDVYYMFNEMFDMVVETPRTYLEFLEWTDFRWINNTIFDASIIYLEKMEISIKNGTTYTETDSNKGISGVTEATFSVGYVDSEGNAASGSASGTEITVSHGYVKDGASIGSNLPFTNTDKFKLFYQTLLWSELEGEMPSDSEEKQEALKASAPDMTITLTFDIGDGKMLTKTYRFYFRQAGSSGCYVTVEENNGGANGSFYMLQDRATKIMSDLGRLLSDTATITPKAKK